MTAADGFDETEDAIAALADRIAERLAMRLGTRLSELAGPAESGGSRRAMDR